MSPIGLRPAAPTDVDLVLALMGQAYAELEQPYRPEEARAALQELLGDEHLGRLWIVDDGSGAIGYLVVTFGFSLRSLGREALLDELFILPQSRMKGAGRRALSFAEAVCAELGVRTLHVEVDAPEEGLLDFYRRYGFRDSGRGRMSKPLHTNARR